ncbi:MAG TPA: hypothetical protein VGB88_01810 [Alphaproteobacteria bacterium]
MTLPLSKWAGRRRDRRLAGAYLVAGLLLICVAGSTRAEGATVTRDVTIADRAVVGDQVVRVTEGEHVVLRWTGDEPAEIHLHGYDLPARLVPGEVTAIEFDANATGRFPVTVHGFGDDHGEEHDESALLYVEVHPR